MNTQILSPRGSIILRPAQEADAGPFRELRLESLRAHPEAFSADYAAIASQPEAYWTERVSPRSDGTIFLALYNDQLIGMCGIQRGSSPKTEHSATIWGVYVQSEWRGLRLADALIQNCIEWARAQGIKIAKLGVVSTNTAAMACYQRCGFKIYGTEPQAFYVNGIMYDDQLMARPLSD